MTTSSPGVPNLYANPCKDCGSLYAKFITPVVINGKKAYKILCESCARKYTTEE